MNSKTEAILTRDSLYETEKMVGKSHYSQFNEVENMFALINFMNDNQVKKDHLQSIGDTYWRIPWNDFKLMLLEKGFKQGLCYDIQHRDDEIDEAIIYYHVEKGLIVWATSYWNKESINGGSLYGEIKANSKNDYQHIMKWLSSGRCLDRDNGIFETSHDVREGLFSKLSTLEEAGCFLPVWTDKNRFLWFVDFVEDDVPGYDYKEITLNKIKQCPEEMQNIIFG